MIERLLNLWERLRSSFWFIPSLMALIAVALSMGMVALDRSIADDVVREFGWSYTGAADGARALLGAVATSVITVTGVVFSITVAALTLASSQFGPRLLRNFMRDAVTQLVLGTFISTYLYCLMVLRTVRGDNGSVDAFVPQLSVTLGIVLAAASVGVLIYFIHHIARSMQASQVIANVSRDLRAGIDNLYPDDLGYPAEPERDSAPPGLPSDFEAGSAIVHAEADGYLQLVYDDDVMELTRKHDLIIQLHRRPGNYVIRGSDLARIWPASRVDDDVKKRLRESLSCGSERTPLQDVHFSLDQLVEVALRAMSPGINDPFTAITSIDRIGSALSHLAERKIPSGYRCDDDGRLRVVTEPITFEGFLDSAVCAIRDQAAELASPRVTRHLRKVLLAVAHQTDDPHRRAALMRHVASIDTSR